MFVKKIAPRGALILLTLFSGSVLSNQTSEQETWMDLSDPYAIYSGVSVAGGKEGVNLSAKYGGYLNGQYKHQITVEAMNDLEYYNIDYMLVNSNTNSGFTIESTWDRDIWGLKDINDTSVGAFAKIPLFPNEMGNKLNLYPKLNLGMLWADDIKTTTYLKFDATTRYNFNRMFWAGITPTYTYAMKGIDLSEWQTTFDVGVQLSPVFALSAHVNTDKEYWFDVVFAF